MTRIRVEVAQSLNAEGIKGRRGKPWVSRTVRNMSTTTGNAG
jgi:hypothetical protein